MIESEFQIIFEATNQGKKYDRKENFLASLNHRQPEKPAVDFGSTPVHGMHVSCVSALRRHYGLEDKPVKVIDPLQMLGEIDDELRDILGVSVIGVSPLKTVYGFENKDWKSWRLSGGQEVLVPGSFHTSVADKGDTFIYPRGRLNAPPSGRMPKGGYFLIQLSGRKNWMMS